MKIRYFALATLCGLTGYCTAITADTGRPNYELEIGLTESRLKGVTLGDDQLLDRLDNREITIQFDLEYPLDDQFYVFFGAELFNEEETFKTANTGVDASGFELGGTGVGYTWGEDVEYQLEFGRIEYSDERQWWWDEYLDTIRMQFDLNDIEFMLATGSQQGRERSSDDFIDPQEEDISRVLARINWKLGTDQRVSFYYLSQEDESALYLVSDTIAENRVDESDADLRWFGLAYQGALEADSIGAIDWRIGYAKLSGDEIVYDISDPVANIVTVDDIDSFDIDASAYELSFEWQPTWVDDVSIFYVYAAGSGDANQGDSKIDSFRQSGLHNNEADFLYYGELFQPEVSNIKIHSLGISLGAIDNLDVSLLLHDYRQDEADSEMRDVAIDLDPNGLSRDLGSEIDLIAVYELDNGLELEFVTAVFEAGAAYGANAGSKSRYWSVDLTYYF